jgi:hypothetical protein
MTPKPTSAVERTGLRVVIVTLDNHLASSVDRARRSLQSDLPELDLAFHAAADWNDPAALRGCLESIGKADIIVATMLFMEEHAQAVLPSIRARRDDCDAVVGCMSAPDIVKLTRVGRFNMDGAKGGAFGFLKKLRGGKKSSETGGARELAMLRRIPRLLRFIPGSAQDVRAYFLTLQSGPLSRQSLRGRRKRRASRAVEGGAAGRISGSRALSSSPGRALGRLRRQAAASGRRIARDGWPSVDALVHSGRQHRALRRGHRCF